MIDVQRQTDVKMQLHEFIEYFLSPARTTVLNLISLEFSNTRQDCCVESAIYSYTHTFSCIGVVSDRSECTKLIVNGSNKGNE